MTRDELLETVQKYVPPVLFLDPGPLLELNEVVQKEKVRRFEELQKQYAKMDKELAEYKQMASESNHEEES